MTVKELSESFGYRVLCMPDESREVKGGYAGDLLSWVMGRLNAGNVWVTIMSNVNIVAVATLGDPSCIILSEGVVPEQEVIDRAQTYGINLLTTEKTTFAVCAEIVGAL